MQNRNTHPLHPALALLAAGFTSLAPLHAATVIDMDDLVRPPATGANTFILGTSNTPATTWSSSSTSATFASYNGALVVYFPTVTLNNVGESISLNFTAKFTNFDSATNGFRVGMLYNGTSTLISADSTNANATNAKDYYGYIGLYRPKVRLQSGEPVDDGSILRRNGGIASSQLLGGTAITGAKSLASGLPSANFADPAEDYTGAFTITRTGADQITVSSQWGSETLQSGIDSGEGLVTSFNTITFYLTAGGSPTLAPTITFSEFSITTIPEPGSTALLIGGAALGGVFLRRLHRPSARP